MHAHSVDGRFVVFDREGVERCRVHTIEVALQASRGVGVGSRVVRAEDGAELAWTMPPLKLTGLPELMFYGCDVHGRTRRIDDSLSIGAV